MIGELAWAVRPKWHRLESPRSYLRRQCEAAGVPLEIAERGLTTRAQPYLNRVWAVEGAAAAIVEAGAGRPAGHYARLKGHAQPDPEELILSDSSVGYAALANAWSRSHMIARTGAFGILGRWYGPVQAPHPRRSRSFRSIPLKHTPNIGSGGWLAPAASLHNFTRECGKWCATTQS